MGLKKSGARRAHGGVRLSKLPVSAAAATTSPKQADHSHHQQQQQQQQHVVHELDPVFAYCEIPDEVLVGTELDLSLWSVVAHDSCLQRLGGRNATKNHNSKPASIRALINGSASQQCLRQNSAVARQQTPPLSSLNQLADAVVGGSTADAVATDRPAQFAVVYLNLAGAEHVSDDVHAWRIFIGR